MAFESNLDTAYLQQLAATAIFKWDAIHNATDFQANSGTWNIDTETNDYLGCRLCNAATHGINEYVALGTVLIPYSTEYTAYMIHDKSVDRANAHIMLNNVDCGTVKMYKAAPGVYNVITEVSLGTLTKGFHDVALMLLDKEAGSTNYYCFMTALAIVKTV